MAESMTPTGDKTKARTNVNGNSGLLLYSYHHCFYTQKVLMALYEKKIPFTTNLIDITKREQYQPWYLKINPRGEVPVLKDGIKYIPDSERIIQYLEDNFSNGEHSRLIPIDQGPEIKQKVIKFHMDIDSIPANVVTLGSLFNSEYCTNLKYPFVLPSVQKLLRGRYTIRGLIYSFRKAEVVFEDVLLRNLCHRTGLGVNYIQTSEKSGADSLRELATKIPEYCNILLLKANEHDKRTEQITNKDEFFKVIQKVENLLDKVENELSSHNKNTDQAEWWLCMDRFTIADISLTILLDRLSRIGLEAYFWGKGKRPNVDKYYRRVQKRDSYKKTIPSFKTDLSIILRRKAPLIISVSLLTVLTVVVGGYIYFRK